MKLQVLISTHKPEGLEKVGRMVLPRVEGVGYLVSCQSQPVPVPEALRRDDVEVHFTDSKGISANRNNAIAHATAQYVLMGDDDLEYYADGLKGVIDAFDANPDVDVAAFMYDGPSAKVYPDGEHDLWVPCKNYYVTSFEIAARLESVKRHSLYFREDMGVGTDYILAGEENVWLLAAKRRGLKGRFFPIAICRHDDIPTGLRLQSQPGVLRAAGVYISLAYGASKYPRFWLKAWRTPGNPLRNLFYILQGHIYAHRLIYF